MGAVGRHCVPLSTGAQRWHGGQSSSPREALKLHRHLHDGLRDWFVLGLITANFCFVRAPFPRCQSLYHTARDCFVCVWRGSPSGSTVEKQENQCKASRCRLESQELHRQPRERSSEHESGGERRRNARESSRGEVGVERTRARSESERREAKTKMSETRGNVRETETE